MADVEDIELRGTLAASNFVPQRTWNNRQGTARVTATTKASHPPNRPRPYTLQHTPQP